MSMYLHNTTTESTQLTHRKPHTSAARCFLADTLDPPPPPPPTTPPPVAPPPPPPPPPTGRAHLAWLAHTRLAYASSAMIGGGGGGIGGGWSRPKGLQSSQSSAIIPT